MKKKYYVASEYMAAKRWVNDPSRKGDEILIETWNEETRIGLDGGFRFYEVSNKPYPRLELYEDAWAGLNELGTPFLCGLAKLDQRNLGRVPTVKDITDMLDTVGFQRGDPSKHDDEC